jgi:hypothetical protein
MAGAIEGLGTTLTIGSATLCFITLGAIGVDGGEKLDATCLDATEWKSYLPQTLKEVPDMGFTGKFDPTEWQSIVDEVNVNQLITVDFAYQGVDLGSISFWGYLKSFVPAEGAIGVRWEATGTLVASNMNASDVETGPFYTAP